MAKNTMKVSIKRIQIDKANSMIVIAVALAAFLTAFSLVASRSLLVRRSYQSRVITAQEQARDQLQANIGAVDSLKTSYTEFVSRQENIIEGSSTGNGERDGDNAKIVLDALPSKYDYPALAASLEKILADRNYTISNISGTDEEASMAEGGASATGAATDTQALALGSQTTQQQQVGTATEMPFELGAIGTYETTMDLLKIFRNSIRPLYVNQLTLTASEGNAVEVKIIGKTYYQPEKPLEIKEEVVQ